MHQMIHTLNDGLEEDDEYLIFRNGCARPKTVVVLKLVTRGLRRALKMEFENIWMLPLSLL